MRLYAEDVLLSVSIDDGAGAYNDPALCCESLGTRRVTAADPVIVARTLGHLPTSGVSLLLKTEREFMSRVLTVCRDAGV